MTAQEQFNLIKPYGAEIIDEGIQNRHGDTGFFVKLNGVSTVLYDGEEAKIEEGWLWTIGEEELKDGSCDWMERFKLPQSQGRH